MVRINTGSLVVRGVGREDTYKVCPYVSSLRMQAEDATKASTERWHGGPVSVQQEIIVLQPVWEHVMRNNPPPALPNLHTHTTKWSASN